MNYLHIQDMFVNGYPDNNGVIHFYHENDNITFKLHKKFDKIDNNFFKSKPIAVDDFEELISSQNDEFLFGFDAALAAGL